METVFNKKKTDEYINEVLKCISLYKNNRDRLIQSIEEINALFNINFIFHPADSFNITIGTKKLYFNLEGFPDSCATDVMYGLDLRQCNFTEDELRIIRLCISLIVESQESGNILCYSATNRQKSIDKFLRRLGFKKVSFNAINVNTGNRIFYYFYDARYFKDKGKKKKIF